MTGIAAGLKAATSWEVICVPPPLLRPQLQEVSLDAEVLIVERDADLARLQGELARLPKIEIDPSKAILWVHSTAWVHSVQWVHAISVAELVEVIAGIIGNFDAEERPTKA
jgi:hypothetical protein